MLKRVLIANRGEIARRVARTCRRLGVEYVAVHSDADRSAAHLRGALDSVRIGPAPASESYLQIDRIVDAALRTGCDAVHPGYGFLSENADFAAAVVEAGLVFIGPNPTVIAAMGDKATARAVMAQAGVPVLPGSEHATESLDQLAADAARIGYPVILKPVAGGGGKGMQVVTGPAGLPAAADESIRLGRSAFGDGRLLVERYVTRPRHIEVQIFGDASGQVVHLFERECSLQRRHQKIVEEAPAPDLPDELRTALLEAAVRGATALRYSNAGTFEFILDADGGFFFLEVNTRLQVEHPVTEEVTGVDLVEWQLRIADGQPLPLAQAEIVATGHAIECRVYAEDPSADFRPAPGEAAIVRWPSTVRVEAAFDESGAAPGFYDPMIAKLVARGPDRAAAVRELRRAVQDTAIVGLTTNLGFLSELLAHPRVVTGAVDTHLVDTLVGGSGWRPPTGAAAACAAAVVAHVPDRRRASPWSGAVGPVDRRDLDPRAPWGQVVTRAGDQTWIAAITGVEHDGVQVEVDGRRFDVVVSPDPRAERNSGLLHGTVGESRWTGLRTPHGFELVVDGYRVRLEAPEFVVGGSAAVDDVVRSSLPGTLVGLPVVVGQAVRRGDVLAVVEAMKMENPLLAPRNGLIEEIRGAVGQVVAADEVLIVLVKADHDD